MNKTFLGAFLASVFISSQPVRKKISNRTQILQQNSREILLIRMIRERISCRSIRLPTVRQSQLFPVPKEPENELVVEPEE